MSESQLNPNEDHKKEEDPTATTAIIGQPDMRYSWVVRLNLQATTTAALPVTALSICFCEAWSQPHAPCSSGAREQRRTAPRNNILRLRFFFTPEVSRYNTTRKVKSERVNFSRKWGFQVLGKFGSLSGVLLSCIRLNVTSRAGGKCHPGLIFLFHHATPFY